MEKKHEDCNDTKEVDRMPTMELVEFEKAAYVNEMELYLQNLKNMPITEAKKRSKKNLIECQILTKKGELAAKYK